MELTDNDRQRIEQEAKKNMRKYYGTEANFLRDSTDSDYELTLFKAGAEYATIFERQQQANKKPMKEHEEDKKKICNKVGLSSTLEQIVFECMESYANQRVEAERDELQGHIKWLLEALRPFENMEALGPLESMKMREIENFLKTKL